MLALFALLPLLASLGTASPVRRAVSQQIKSYRTGNCLSTEGGRAGLSSVTDGTAVVDLDCSLATLWDISPGSGSVVLSGTTFALDAGTGPHNNVPAKVWTSYPGLTQQTWFLTGDNRIAITGGNQCLDEGDAGPQTYQCTTGNTNQIWYVSDGHTQPSSTSPPPTSTISSSSSTGPTSTGIPSGVVYPDPAPGGGSRLHPYGRSDLCMTVQNGYAGIGAAVDISYCFSLNDPDVELQLWDFDTGTPGLIGLHGSGLCLDAGDNPANGSGVKVYTCYGGLLQQNWSFGSDGRLRLTNGQCLDVQLGSTPGSQKPYNSLENLQTYQCSPGDDQQDFCIQPFPSGYNAPGLTQPVAPCPTS